MTARRRRLRMSVGKNPHRPEGKTEHAARATQRRMENRMDPERHASEAMAADKKRVSDPHGGGGPREYPAKELDQPMGGSRPGVESRVKNAIRERLDRE